MECEHGVTIDWGHFGPCQDCEIDHPGEPNCPNFTTCEDCDADFSDGEATIDWVSCGAESGPRNRPMMDIWARSMRDQCVDAGIPFMLKQFATDKGKKISLPLLDGEQWAQMPEVHRG